MSRARDTTYEPDETALSIVVNERVAMRLRGGDQIEAIRRLIDRGLTVSEIAKLLQTTSGNITRLRKNNNLPEPETGNFAWWSVLIQRNRGRRAMDRDRLSA